MTPEALLRDNILSFWDRLADPRGGFFGEADAAGRIREDAPRGAVLGARIVWAYSAAYNALGDPHYLDMARWAGDYFLRHFIDPRYGGVYWSVDAQGRVLDGKKQSYAQAFGIYGLSELYRACGERPYLDAAVDLWSILEGHYADPVHGGYTEALDRDFGPLEDMSLSRTDLNAPRTMNSHLHLAEAFANLYSVWPESGLRRATTALLDLLSGPMTGPDGHLGLYFREDWTWLPGHPSPGHDIEASWLLLECARALQDQALEARLKPCCQALAQAGAELAPQEQWWVYAESVVGNLWQGNREKALEWFSYICRHLVDPAGEWYWSLLPDGTPDRSFPKAGFWKCPYHNTRMCLQLLQAR